MAERMTLDAVLARFREEAQGNKAALGARFERFVRAVLTRVPLYQGQFRRVWLWSELGQGHDTGIDLVAEAHDGALYGIQAKCYEDGHVVSKPDIDTFLARLGAPIVFEGAKRAFAHGLLFSSTDAWGAHVEAELRDRAIPVQVMTLSRLRALEADWAVLAGFAEGPAVPPKALRDYQAEALANAARHYAAHDRGKLIMACGTGKTFTSLRLVEQETGGKGLALFLVPSIALLNQTLVAWCDDAARPIHAVQKGEAQHVGKGAVGVQIRARDKAPQGSCYFEPFPLIPYDVHVAGREQEEEDELCRKEGEKERRKGKEEHP